MIYTTAEEWKEIQDILEEKGFDKAVQEITSRVYVLGISQKELDDRVKYSISLKDFYDFTTSMENDFNDMVEGIYKSIDNLDKEKK